MGRQINIREIDLVLVEHTLAKKFGKDLLDVKKESTLEMEVIPILIGLPYQANPNPWLKAGFDDFIHLPFSREVLTTRLEVWLRLQEEYRWRFKSLYENATLGLYRTTPDGRILLANPALVKMLGYDSLEDLQQRNLETEGFEPGYDRASFRQRLEREGVIRGLEEVWKRKDGSSVFIRESACVIRDSEGHVLCYEGTVEDITERLSAEQASKQAEEALKKSEEMFRDLYENAPNAYLSVGVDGKILRCNQRVRELLGYAVDKLVGRPVLDLYADTPYGKTKAKRVFKRFQAGETVRNEELQMQKMDGTPIWISLTVNAFRDDQGRVIESRSMVVDITERKRTEEALRESEEKYRGLYNSIRDAILVVDTHRNIIDCNAAFTSLFGYTLDEMKGKQTVYIYEREAEFEALGQALKKHFGESPFLKTVNYKKKTGEIFPGETSVFYLKDDQGTVVGFIGLIRDISLQKKAEIELRNSEQRYRDLFEYSSDAIFMHDFKGNIIDVNRKTLSLFGYRKPEILRLTVMDLHPNSALKKSRKAFETVSRNGSVNFEIEFKKKNGVVFPAEVSATIMKLEDEEIVLGIVRDITERRVAEQERKWVEKKIQESEEKFRSIVENSRDVIMLTQPDGIISYLSPSCSEVLGYEPEDLIGKQPWIIHPDDMDLVQKVHFEALKQKKGSSLEYRIKTKGGATRWIDHSFSPVFSEGEFKTVVSIIRDISELKQVEQELRKSLQEKEVLLKEIHHRVKNNLQVVSSLLNLQAEGFQDRRVRALFDESRDRIRSMALVHENLYQSEDYTQVNFGEYLKKLTKQLLRVYQKDAAAVTLSLDVAPVQLPMNLAIPCGIVVNELVTNALKHAFPQDREGSITVSFQKKDSRSLVLEVADNGIGIPEDSESGEVTSLGMNLVSILVVDQLRGELNVKQDGGTQVTIQFHFSRK